MAIRASASNNKNRAKQSKHKRRIEMLHTTNGILLTPPPGVLPPEPGSLLPCTAAVNSSMLIVGSMLELLQPAGMASSGSMTRPSCADREDMPNKWKNAKLDEVK